MAKDSKKQNPEVERESVSFPIDALKAGRAVRRAQWKPNFDLRLGKASARTNGKMAFVIHGNRNGPTPLDMIPIDDIMADDWQVIEEPEGDDA